MNGHHKTRNGWYLRRIGGTNFLYCRATDSNSISLEHAESLMTKR